MKKDIDQRNEFIFDLISSKFTGKETTPDQLKEFLATKGMIVSKKLIGSVLSPVFAQEIKKINGKTVRVYIIN